MRGIALLTLITAGCGAKSTCVPGQSEACVCADGTGGSQVCKGDGTYGACACGTTIGTGGNGGSSGGAGGGGSSGAGGGAGGAGGGGGTTSGAKRVFVTSAAYAGTAIVGICQTVAESATLGGTWTEWLSFGSVATPRNAIDAVHGTGPWLLLDGTVAFANHAQLATSPTVPLTMTEHMQTLAATDDEVWTGTLTGGTHSSVDCNDWSATNYNGSLGRASLPASWTAANGTEYQCQSTAHVYCFEQ